MAKDVKQNLSMNNWIEKEIEIGEIESLLDYGYEIEVDSPDGWVGVNFFIDKGIWDEYQLILEDGAVIKCNEAHLFETMSGWQKTSELYQIDAQHYLTENGYIKGIVIKTGCRIPIVDINVQHDNHRYYTNGVSSHNTGVGKSLFMCHVAAGALMQSKNVLYLTMEMSENRIAERIDANLLNMTIDELGSVSKDIFETRIGRLIKKTQGKLIVKEYPTSSAHAGHFKVLLNELKSKKNFIPDLIVVDYLNICSSSRVKLGSGANSYTVIKSIAEELRGLAQEYDVPLLTATQSNREAQTSTDIDLTNTSESIGLPQTCDLMLALISSEELENLNQLMIKQLKNRYNDPSYYKRFVVGIDRSKMRLFDLEESAQKDIIDSGQDKDDDMPAFDKSSFGKRMKTAATDFKF